MNKIKIGSDFSGVGAFNQALKRLGINYEEVFACDMDKYARQTFILNHGEPKDFPIDVYDREIPKESLDIFMTSPPCQAFSLAGKRKGEDDKRGILFYNSHEFIQKNKPRFFIFENVKGLLSDSNGKTFQKWCAYLGGKSVNGNPTLFPEIESVPYHIYYKVLNAKNYGIPQNRERIFIVGIRDDQDNEFTWPKEIPLEKRLKDVLETEVDEKYFLSEKFLNYCYAHKEIHSDRGNGFAFEPKKENDIAGAISTKAGTRQTDNYVEAKIGAIRGRNPENPKSRFSGLATEQTLEINENGTSNALTTVQKDNVVILHNLHGGFDESEPRIFTEYSPTIRTAKGGGHIPSTITHSRIRRLTPLECFRLMDFNQDFKWDVSDTQSYKQAGNSICVGVLAGILAKLKLFT
jgi:DNA (cytosine-5)-methyltransferase 1